MGEQPNDDPAEDDVNGGLVNGDDGGEETSGVTQPRPKTPSQMQTGVGFFQWLLSLFAANGGGSQTSPTNPNPNSPGGPPAPPPAGASGGGPPGVTHGARSVLATDWNGKDGSPWAGVQGPSASQQFAQMVENGINTLDQAVAGVAGGVTGGATTRLRAYLYGPQATMNHQGPAYQAGQVVGTAIGFVTMFANPCTMGAAAGGSLRALNGIQAGQSLYDAGQKAQAGDYAGAAWDVADAAFSLMDVFGKCFVPGTPILTPGGSKAIEEFREGDLVLSRDEHDADGEVEVRVVEHVFARTSQVWELKVGGRSIGTTAEHPFWVEGRGWTIAARLVEGDRLGTLDGESVVLEGISSGDELVTVYNMRIGDYHTYFVGDPTWGFSVWAHNADYVKGQQGQAPRTAVDAADDALAAGKTRGAASQLDVNGRRFIDISGPKPNLDPRVQEALDSVPPAKRAPWHGQCSEVGCVDQAFKAGVDPRGGTSIAVNIGQSGTGHGTFKEACRSCQGMLQFLGVRF